MSLFRRPRRLRVAEGSSSAAVPIALIEPDEATMAMLAASVAGRWTLHRMTSIEELASSGLADVPGLGVVLGPTLASPRALSALADLSPAVRARRVVLVTQEADVELLRLALRLGVEDAIPLERVGTELPMALSSLGQGHGAGEHDSAAAERELGDFSARGAPGRVVTVFSPKGGAGKSVVSVNLAATLARRGRRVVLVDADLALGDVSVMLRLDPAHTIAEAAGRIDRLDATLVGGLLTRHEPTGLEVLAAPPSPSDAEKITPSLLAGVLGVLTTMAELVVVDTPPVLDDLVLQLLADSDVAVLVVSLDVPSVKNARLGVEALELVRDPAAPVLLVLNRAGSKVYLSTRDVERTLGLAADVTLPSDVLVPRSINKGVPAALAYERSRFAGGIRRLADLVVTSRTRGGGR
jgi:pilus assembly protein CpaE